MFEESEARTKMWPQKCQLTCRSSWYSLVAPQSSLSLRSGQPAQSGDNSYTWSALWQRSQHHRPGAHKWRSSQQSHCDPEKKKKRCTNGLKQCLLDKIVIWYDFKSKKSSHPQFGHVGSSQTANLWPVRHFAHIDPLQEHFKVKTKDVMALQHQKENAVKLEKLKKTIIKYISNVEDKLTARIQTHH